MVALTSCDDLAALRLAGLDEILSCHLECGFDGFRAARDEVDVIEPGRCVRDEALGKCFGHFAREEAGVGISEFVRLRMKRRDDVRMPVAEAGDGGAARGVDVGASVLVEQFDAPAA